MEIKIKQLENIFVLLLEKLKQEKIETIVLEEALYWEVPYDQFASIEKPIDAMDVGSLEDDWTILQTTLANGILLDNDDFNRIANILKAIGLKWAVVSEIE